MKLAEKAKARELRKEGLSITHIAKELGVAKSSVSGWTRDIELTPEQCLVLRKRPGAGDPSVFKERSNKYREVRMAHQREGRALARREEALHIQGCIIYWAEGSKTQRNAVKFANSNPHCHRLYLKFLRAYFPEEAKKVTLRLNVFEDESLSLLDIETYWLNILGLERECLRKHTIKPAKRSKDLLQEHSRWGTCYLSLSSTYVTQHIYGAIQEYADMEWGPWNV